MCQDGNACPEPVWIAIVQYFEDLPDPRSGPNAVHKLVDIVVIAVCAVMAGSEACTQIAEFGHRKESWLRQFLELPAGIPSHDTFSRVLAMLDAKKFEECFMRWAATLQPTLAGKIVAIDGKTLRHSFDRAKDRGPLHLVSAWCSESHVSLGQVAVDSKSNEITAIPQLVDLLELEGAIVTIDAAGCQRAIVSKLRRKKADYVLALKGNQDILHDEVATHFKRLRFQESPSPPWQVYETHEKGHGREEHRTAYVVPVPENLRNRELWKDLTCLVMIVSRRVVQGREETQARYYISSLPVDAERLAKAVRWHWGIENSLHWVLDVTFREDDSRIRKGFGSENMATLRRLAINLLKREPTKQSLATKRLMAAWDNDYLFRVLLAAGRE
jgi:predicted transposase YbfD/YdcC